ncbi:MAG: aminotransferase class V-fold PLP-dependent enzyme, partial [Desulfosporosinus sp.]|nr:aminotransferase class V-fold PLP-dependent enzyme [Desulfosporosinus sp.]
HTDATQMMGKYYLHPERLGVDLMTGSAHKFHGPRGVGILYAREGVINPSATTMTGGGQERGCRSGTENVPAIYGAAIAFDNMMDDVSRWEERVTRVKTLRDTMMETLRRSVPGLIVNGDPYNGLYNTMSISFPNAHGHAICAYANKGGVAIGSGSACSKGKPSETLQAMLGDSDVATKIIHGTVRISLSHLNTASQCSMAVDIIIRAWRATLDENREEMKRMEQRTKKQR